MGISGIGYGSYDRFSMNGFPSIPSTNQAQALDAQAPGTAQTGAAGITGQPQKDAAAGATAGAVGVRGTTDIQALKRMGAVECQTCKSRMYQDGSTDAGVSFKAPGHIDPASSGAVVMGHEQEHVANERAKAAASGRRVVSQSVRVFTSICPECGRAYVSGGETRTVTASDNSPKQAAAAYKPNGNSAGRLFSTSA